MFTHPHVSRVMCQVSQASRGRVCYQRGLPRLVMIGFTNSNCFCFGSAVKPLKEEEHFMHDLFTTPLQSSPGYTQSSNRFIRVVGHQIPVILHCYFHALSAYWSTHVKCQFLKFFHLCSLCNINLLRVNLFYIYTPPL